jgi:hypothetical protein
VAVTRSPLDDIHAISNVEFVTKQGTVYKQ